MEASSAPAVPAGTSPLRLAGAAVGAVLAVAALVHFGLTGQGLVAAIFVATLAAVSVTDLEQRRIPNRIVLPATALVLVAQLALRPGRAVEWVVAAVGAAAFLLLPSLVAPGGMGMGDVKLALLLGAALGRDVMPALVFALAFVFVAAVVVLVRRGRAGGRTMLPFGPFLALGGVLALFLS
jgi:prepilin signal peptidase PulO-like enzyme (type II secretory pathway)